VLKKWLGRGDQPLTDEERRWLHQIVQRIAALIALGLALDGLYQEVAAGRFTITDLKIDKWHREPAGRSGDGRRTHY